MSGTIRALSGVSLPTVCFRGKKVKSGFRIRAMRLWRYLPHGSNDDGFNALSVWGKRPIKRLVFDQFSTH